MRLFRGLALSGSTASTHPNQRQPGARRALWILTSLSLLNYADRYVISAVLSSIEKDLGLDDVQAALPATGMTIVYMFCSIFFGLMNDKKLIDRRWLLFYGIILWSVATSLAGFSTNLTSLVMYRSLVGVGEAAYVTIAPPMLCDYYPKRERNIMFGIYYLSLPVGGALGFGIGAALGAFFNWRVAFYAIGFPGVFTALLILKLTNPPSNINDHDGEVVIVKDEDNNVANVRINKEKKGNQKLDWKVLIHELYLICSNPHFIFCNLGAICNSFALGGLAVWYPTFLLRYSPGDPADPNKLFYSGLVAGASTIVGGILGNVMGAYTVDYFKFRFKNAAYLVSSLFCIPAFTFMCIAVNYTSSFIGMAALLIIAEVFAFTNLAPMSDVSITCIPVHLRSRSQGVSIFIQHVLGDVISPPIIGAISSSQITSTAPKGNLQAGLQVCWVAIIFNFLFWFVGYFVLTPLDYKKEKEEEEVRKSSNTLSQNGDNEKIGYCKLLCGRDTLHANEDGSIIEFNPVIGIEEENVIDEFINKNTPKRDEEEEREQMVDNKKKSETKKLDSGEIEIINMDESSRLKS